MNSTPASDTNFTTANEDIAIIQTMVSQWKGLSEGETDFLVNSAQFCALIKQWFKDVSWVGFYWWRNNELVLGSFQGPVACTRIAIDKGVCGAAYRENSTQVVEDVHAFEGHVVCDADAASELVLPVEVNGKVLGVLDFDSYKTARFNQAIAHEFELLLKGFVESTEFPAYIFEH